MRYESRYLNIIQREIKEEKQALEQVGMERQLSEALTANINHERAREQTEHKLVPMREEMEKNRQDLWQAKIVRDSMQSQRNIADLKRVTLSFELDALRKIKQRLDEMERAKGAVEERYILERQARERLERERDEALLLATELRNDRAVADIKFAETGGRRKDTVGACLSVAASQSSEKRRLEGEVFSWINKCEANEKEIMRVHNINAAAQQAVKEARLKKVTRVAGGRSQQGNQRNGPPGSSATTTPRSRYAGVATVVLSEE
jgi:hypothetical protein